MDKILFVVVLFLFVSFQCLAAKRKSTLHQSFLEASYSFFFYLFIVLIFCYALKIFDCLIILLRNF